MRIFGLKVWGYKVWDRNDFLRFGMSDLCRYTRVVICGDKNKGSLDQNHPTYSYLPTTTYGFLSALAKISSKSENPVSLTSRVDKNISQVSAIYFLPSSET